MKKIAIFNHKGGVSKTTTSFNLGYALVRNGKKVLLVDIDSQCNLTLYAMGFGKYTEYCESKNKNNIYDCLEPAYKSQPRLIEPAECYKLTDGLFCCLVIWILRKMRCSWELQCSYQVP